MSLTKNINKNTHKIKYNSTLLVFLSQIVNKKYFIIQLTRIKLSRPI